MRPPFSRSLLLVFPLVLATACQSTKPNPPAPAPAPAPVRNASVSNSVNKAFALTPAQIRTLANLADQGNTAAAERLGDYYAMVVLDTPRAIACYRVGAQHGSARCRHNMEELQREDAQFAHKG
jgi:hypothetical protein